MTWLVQRAGGAVSDLDALPFAARVANAAVTYVTYLGRTCWPVDLGTLVPVIGLVQVGQQASADRYTYAPLVGIFAILAWGAHDLLGARPRLKAALAGAALLACAALTVRQLSFWRDSTTLFERTLAVTRDNAVVHNNLGGVHLREGRAEQAVAHFDAARRIRPDYAAALSNLGVASASQGKLGEAIALFREALRLKPSDPAIAAFVRAVEDLPAGPRPSTPSPALPHFDRGNALRNEGRLAEAEAAYREAIRLDPRLDRAHNNLGILLAMAGRADEAAAEFLAVLRLNPRDAAAHLNLGVLLAKQGRRDEAAGHFEEALRLEPGNDAAERALAQVRR